MPILMPPEMVAELERELELAMASPSDGQASAAHYERRMEACRE